MTEPFVWLEVNAAVQGPAGPPGADTLYGHGTTFATSNPFPKDGEGRFEQSTGAIEFWNAATESWRPYAPGPGAEYMDMDSGNVWQLRPAVYDGGGDLPGSRPQRVFTLSEADFDAHNWPSEALPGDVVLSRTGGKSQTL